MNQSQRSILVGLLLGDGHLETVTRDRTYRLKVEHSLKQKEYVDWLYEQWKDFIKSKPYLKEKTLVRKKFSCCGFTTHSSAEFRFYAQQFYAGRKKVIPKLFAKLIDPMALAIWFMDDGSFKSIHHKTYIIHAIGYTKSELRSFKKFLKRNLALRSHCINNMIGGEFIFSPNGG